jgi:hypothetical protein
LVPIPEAPLKGGPQVVLLSFQFLEPRSLLRLRRAFPLGQLGAPPGVASPNLLLLPGPLQLLLGVVADGVEEVVASLGMSDVSDHERL